MSITFVSITTSIAHTLLTWRYPPPYDFYNLPADPAEDAVAALMTAESPQWIVLDGDGTLLGVIGIGIESQVQGGDYSEPATDVGIGLHPDRCGRGLGRIVVAEFMAFIEAELGPTPFRATIAAFNERSQKTFAALGFTESTRFTTTRPDGSTVEWVIVTRPVS